MNKSNQTIDLLFQPICLESKGVMQHKKDKENKANGELLYTVLGENAQFSQDITSEQSLKDFNPSFP